MKVKLKFGAGCYCFIIFDKDLAFDDNTDSTDVSITTLNHRTLQLHHNLVDYNHIGQHKEDLTVDIEWDLNSNPLASVNHLNDTVDQQP